MLVKCLQICAVVFINRPQNCAQTSFRSHAGLWQNFGRSRVKGLGYSRSKLCPILCRLRTKLCPNFGRSHARLCPISFAPCPFPNVAGTLIQIIHSGISGTVLVLAHQCQNTAECCTNQTQPCSTPQRRYSTVKSSARRHYHNTSHLMFLPAKLANMLLIRRGWCYVRLSTRLANCS